MIKLILFHINQRANKLSKQQVLAQGNITLLNKIIKYTIRKMISQMKVNF